MTAPARKPQRRPVVLLRPVPGRTVVHDLWAGTKLIVVAGIGVLLTFYPGWVPIARGRGVSSSSRRGWPGFRAVCCRRCRAGCGSCWRSAVSPPRLPAAAPSSNSSDGQLGLGGLLKFLRHHRAVDRAARARWHGVVDHQRRRNRARCRETRTPAARAADTRRRLGGHHCAGAAGISHADRRVPHPVRGAQSAPQAGAHDAAGPQAPLGARSRRPDRRGRHRGVAAGRRDGRRDHRARRRGPDLGGADGPETARLGGTFDRGRGLRRWRWRWN